MSRILALAALFTCGVFLGAASAQSSDIRFVPPGTTAAEATIGYTGFGDDGLIHHTGTGATVRRRRRRAAGLAAQCTRRHRNGAPASGWPAFAGGGGLRVWLSRRLYVTTSVRAGLPRHTRIAAGVGVLVR
jgi:hypothetical protein